MFFPKFRISLIAGSFLLASFLPSCTGVDTAPQIPYTSPDGIYTIVTHNAENIFDADGFAVYDDYKPQNQAGESQYTPAHVYKKAVHFAELMQQYNGGRGPDVLLAVELEADFSPNPKPRATEFLKKYARTSLETMFGDGFNDEIADLPSELILLKALWDAGIRDYDVSAPEPPAESNGRPSSVVKNVVFSRIPILHDRTRIHPADDARPVLEVWLDVQGHPLVTFTNHWKSGASNPETERTRIQNATVLRERMDEILLEWPEADIIVAGDLNSDYNQIQRYRAMQETGINTILGAVGDEAAVKRGEKSMYNLWYELPSEERFSDNYYGFWGTLMHLIVTPGMYDLNGVSYVDNSFEVGIFPGINANPLNLSPIRWAHADGGIGYSDHFPLSMQIRVDESQQGRITLQNPGVENTSDWRPVRVTTPRPGVNDLIVMDPAQAESYLSAMYYDRFFSVNGTFNDDGTVQIGDVAVDLFAPHFRLPEFMAERIARNDSVTFIGRLGNYRNRWQFIIDEREFIQ